MIGLLLKNWKWIVDIILVIALVLLLFIWNPFGLFGGGLKLSPTANLVTQIKDMGQIVTSEYYGEVIASIEESKVNYLEEEAVAEKASLLYDRLYEAMDFLCDFQQQPVDVREASFTAGSTRDKKKIIKADVSRRNIVEKLNYHGLLEDFSYEPLYADVLAFIWSNSPDNNNWKGNSRQKEEALLIVYQRAEKNQNQDFQRQRFIEFYYTNKLERLPKKESKKRLAMVGRGWVKAGFDFSTLDNSNFYINEDAGEVHFFGLSATILNSDINPWFIPEKGIPGFEILDYNGKVDFKDARTLKLYCIDKLVVKAHEADIIKNAEIHGAEILRNIFSLLTQKEIKKVFFHHDDIIRLSKTIAEDAYISYYEAALLDSVIKEEYHIIDSLLNTRVNSYKNIQLAKHRQENIQRISAMLSHLPFENSPGTYNPFSRLAYEIAQDSIIDQKEMDQIASLRASSSQTAKSDSVVPKDSLQYAADYNNLIKSLFQYRVKVGTAKDTILTKEEFADAFVRTHHVLNYQSDQGDKLTATYFVQDTKDELLYELLYPYRWTSSAAAVKITVDSLPVRLLDSIPLSPEKTVFFLTTPSPHLKVVNIPLDQWMEPLLLKEIPVAQNMWISSNLAIVRAKGISGESKKDISYFTAQQSGELERFIGDLFSHYEQSNKIGPVVRASNWVTAKFENNTSLPEWLTKVKTKLFSRWD